MVVYLFCLATSFLSSADIFKEICKTSFVLMQEEMSDEVQGLYTVYPGYTYLAINTTDAKNVKIAQRTADYGTLFSSYLKDNPHAKEINVPISRDTLKKCDAFLRRIPRAECFRQIPYNEYSFYQLLSICMGCKALQVADPIYPIQDILLDALIDKISPQCNVEKLDQKLVSYIDEKVNAGSFKERFIVGYCKDKDKISYKSNSASDTKMSMTSLKIIQCWKDSSNTITSMNNGFYYSFNWEIKSKKLLFSIKSEYGNILETELIDKYCDKILIGELHNCLCVVLEKDCYYKALVIDYMALYNEALKILQDHNAENTLCSLIKSKIWTNCTASLQKVYKQGCFTYSIFDKQ